MRYYSIEIGNGKRYTSHPKGPSQPPDPGALQVEMDIFVRAYAQADLSSWVRIWGISLEEIGQAFNLNLKSVKIFGGMGKGLPLANPTQAGLLVDGSIIQSFGNWVGTDMTLDMSITAPQTPDLKTLETPRNLVLNWKKDTELKDAIKNSLSLAFPNYTADIQIKDGLKLDHDEQDYAATLGEFSNKIKGLSKDLVGQNYPGVDVMLTGTTFKVRDASSEKSPKTISFLDLIGQPTWLAPNEVSVTTVMRADIVPFDFITLPRTQVQVTQQAALSALSGFRQSSVFKGTFYVKTVRHVGNFRQPDGRAWTTVIDCVSTGSSQLGEPASATDQAPIHPYGFGDKKAPYN